MLIKLSETKALMITLNRFHFAVTIITGTFPQVSFNNLIDTEIYISFLFGEHEIKYKVNKVHECEFFMDVFGVTKFHKFKVLDCIETVYRPRFPLLRSSERKFKLEYFSDKIQAYDEIMKFGFMPPELIGSDRTPLLEIINSGLELIDLIGDARSN